MKKYMQSAANFKKKARKFFNKHASCKETGDVSIVMQIAIAALIVFSIFLCLSIPLSTIFWFLSDSMQFALSKTWFSGVAFSLIVIVCSVVVHEKFCLACRRNS